MKIIAMVKNTYIMYVIAIREVCMKTRRMLPLLLCIAPFFPIDLLNGAISVEGLKPLTEKPIVGKTCEIAFVLSQQFDDPFDPAAIAVDAEIVCPKRTYSVPGFYYEPFVKTESGAITRAGAPGWRVRFLPEQPGAYRLTISITAGGKKITAPTLAVQVESGRWSGLVRKSKYNPLLLMTENGEPVYFVGVQIFGKGLVSLMKSHKTFVDTWIDKDVERITNTAEHGGNFIRLRMDGGWYPIESSPNPDWQFQGLGKYNQRACWDIDRFFKLCEEKGVHIQLCMEDALAIVNDQTYNFLEGLDFYSKAKGGVLEKKNEFWTSDAAKKYFKRKIRYLVARWGASPALAVWEYFNEVTIKKTDQEKFLTWLTEMGAEFKKTDPHQRILTTSMMNDAVDDAVIWETGTIDIMQEHVYGFNASLFERCQTPLTSIKKPLIVGEWGVPYRKAPKNPDLLDPQAVVPHIGNWQAMFAMSSSSALYWWCSWWTDFTTNEYFWGDIQRLQLFASGIPYKDKSLQTCKVEVRQAPVLLPAPQDHIITAQTFWRKAQTNRFQIGNNGSCTPSATLLGYLWGNVHHPEMKNPPVFSVNNKSPWRFGVRVYRVDNDDSNIPLSITIDDQKPINGIIPLDPSSKKVGKKSYELFTNNTYFIDMPPGEHAVRVDYLGTDRISVAYVLEKYLLEEPQPELLATGLAHAQGYEVYLLNRTWNAEWLSGQEKLLPAKDVSIRLPRQHMGSIKAEWIDPKAGKVIRTETVQVPSKEIILNAGTIEHDLVCRIRYLP